MSILRTQFFGGRKHCYLGSDEYSVRMLAGLFETARVVNLDQP
jgi:hypothetical protein